jgi:hypothetical protein
MAVGVEPVQILAAVVSVDPHVHRPVWTAPVGDFPVLELRQDRVELFVGPNSVRTGEALTYYAQVLRHQKRKNEASKLEERAWLIRKASATELSFKEVIDVRDMGKSAATENSWRNQFFRR